MWLHNLAVLLIGYVAQSSPAWLELKSVHYSIFYHAGYENDAAFAHSWMDAAEQLMHDKYGVNAQHYRTSVYLHPAPTSNATVSQAQNRCCAPESEGMKTVTIDLLAPSAPAWKEAQAKSDLGLPKDDANYHAKILLSEYIPIGHYAVQDARNRGGWRYYSAPSWFSQGLQEYDAIFHTTDQNRSVTAQRLLEWAKAHGESFECCANGLVIKDVYSGGATFMAFLAGRFGEGIHARLLRSNAESFEAALIEETGAQSVAELFVQFQGWVTATIGR